MRKKAYLPIVVIGVIMAAALVIMGALMSKANETNIPLVTTTYARESETEGRSQSQPHISTQFDKSIQFVNTDNLVEAEVKLTQCQAYKTRLEQLDAPEEQLGFLDQEKARIANVETDYIALVDNIKEQERLAREEEERWVEKAAQYPEATQVWRYMKDELGWNDYVCAGVMGNMMAEVGGQTLALQPYLYGHSGHNYYGLCQWSARYYPLIQGASIEEQMDFLRDTVTKELNTYGYLYRSGLDYDAFCNLQSSSEAALAFAKAYERCGSGSYGVRQSNAQKAYDFFVD